MAEIAGSGVKWRDPFEVPSSLIPEGMTFQWCAKRADSTGERQSDYEKMLDAGWVLVPKQWIPGGRPMINGNDLMCRPKWMTDKAKIDNVAKARKQVDDWAQRWGAEGFSGGVRTWTGDPNKPLNWNIIGDKDAAQITIRGVPALSVLEERKAVTADIDAAFERSVVRVPRHPWFAWLFNLISKEVTR